MHYCNKKELVWRKKSGVSLKKELVSLEIPLFPETMNFYETTKTLSI